MSVRPSNVRDVTCSGLKYETVPTSVPVFVRRSSLVASARPKSITRARTWPASSRAVMMFSGLMSRWTMPRAWL